MGRAASICRNTEFELVARRLAGYAVAMEVARRAEGPEVNGDLRKTVSRRSLVPSRELKRKGYPWCCCENDTG